MVLLNIVCTLVHLGKRTRQQKWSSEFPEDRNGTRIARVPFRGKIWRCKIPTAVRFIAPSSESE